MRFRQLDSLRGIAAVTVMLHHFLWARFDTATQTPAMPRGFWMGIKLLHIFFLGHEAVMLFFLLSGMVLTMAIEARHPMRYGHYVLHRICRIVLPYLFSLALAVAGCAFFYARMPHWTPWLAAQWIHAPRWNEVLAHVLFIGTYDQRFNTAYWSLIVEMRISLLLPLMVLVWKRASLPSALWIAGLLTLADAIAHPWFAAHLPAIVGDWLHTLHFGLFFSYGILIALHRSTIESLAQRTSKPVRFACLTAAILVSFYLWPALASKTGERVNLDFLIALGAAVIVCLAMYDESLEAILMWSPFLWLGRISYSLYLVHIIIMMAVISIVGTQVAYRYVYLLAILLSLLCADLMARFVEKPSQLLGRRLDYTGKPRTEQSVSLT